MLSPRRLVALLTVGLLVLLIGGWLIDAGASAGKARRHVSVASNDVGGLDRAAVTSEVEALAAGLDQSRVEVTVGSATASATAGELGLAVDVDATVDAVMSARQPRAVVGWILDLSGSTDVQPVVRFDASKVAPAVAGLNEQLNVAPVEPTIAVTTAGVVAVAGQPGVGVDPGDLTEQLRRVGYTTGVIALRGKEVPVAPTRPLAPVEALADRANAITAAGLEVHAGTASTTLSSAQLRSWFELEPSSSVPKLAIDDERAAVELADLLKAGTVTAVDAAITVVADAPVVIPAVNGEVCCDPSAPGVILDALERGPVGAVVLPMRTTPPAVTTESITALGIVEKVSSFTTKHKPGEARVSNIHHAADILRGTIIPAGGLLSMNAAVGPRTAARGFLIAPTIQDGELKPDYGGGVSQLATTTFNAAFFAGLDYGEYQSHSIYISRYPFAREATMNIPSPDLEIKNKTPYAVLVWTSYTDTTITVDLYSTKWVADVHQGKQTASIAGLSCTIVKTERVITYLDGTTKTDSVRARYRAREGLNCDEPLPPGVRPIGVPGQPPPAVPTTKGGATTTTVPSTPAPTTSPATTTVSTTTVPTTTIATTTTLPP